MSYSDLRFERWLERGQDEMEADGKILINADVQLDEQAMLDAARDAKDWQEQLDADTENLTTEWMK